MKEIESRAEKDAGPGGVAAQSAVIIYRYFAFLHHNDISEDIFRNAAENYKKRDIEQEKILGLPLLVVLLDAKSLFLNEAGKWDRLQFWAGIQTLLSFSLIRISKKGYIPFTQWSMPGAEIGCQQQMCLPATTTPLLCYHAQYSQLNMLIITICAGKLFHILEHVMLMQ